MEAELPGGSGVDMEQVVDGIVDDFEDVGMPGDEEFRVHGLDFLHGARVVMAGITSDVGHQHLHPLALEGLERGIDAAGHAAVDVAAHGAERLECGDPVGQLDRADVARMPDFVHVFQKFAERVVEGSVGVGYNADAFHWYFSFHSCAIRSAILASAAFCVSGS